jgi:hypothetical protein
MEPQTALPAASPDSPQFMSRHLPSDCRSGQHERVDSKFLNVSRIELDAL